MQTSCLSGPLTKIAALVPVPFVRPEHEHGVLWTVVAGASGRPERLGPSTTLAGMRNWASPADVFSEGLFAGGCHEHLSGVGP
jgi:hypothetical protein